MTRFVLLAMIGLALHGQGLVWSQHPKLSWDDFKGKPARFGREPSAVTESGFRTQLVCREGVLDAEAVAEFYPGSSWVKPDRKLARLLTHEQGHFDITELYARKMTRAIREAKIGCESDKAADAAGKKILSRLDSEWERAERTYDIETKDGTDDLHQAAASQRIAAELSAYRVNSQ